MLGSTKTRARNLGDSETFVWGHINILNYLFPAACETGAHSPVHTC